MPAHEAEARWVYQRALLDLAARATAEANRTAAGNPPAGPFIAFRASEESVEEAWQRVGRAWSHLERALSEGSEAPWRHDEERET